MVAFPITAFVALNIDAKRLVVVADVVVAFTAVTSASVVRPEMVRVPVAITLPPNQLSPPCTVSLREGDVVPTPIAPPSTTENTSVVPSKRLRISPAPFCVIERSVSALDVAIEEVAYVRTNSLESRPSSVSETNAAGTAPRILRGLISPSHDGVVEPPISTPR